MFIEEFQDSNRMSQEIDMKQFLLTGIESVLTRFWIEKEKLVKRNKFVLRESGAYLNQGVLSILTPQGA